VVPTRVVVVFYARDAFKVTDRRHRGLGDRINTISAALDKVKADMIMTLALVARMYVAVSIDTH
jgi:hypothetical protein